MIHQAALPKIDKRKNKATTKKGQFFNILSFMINYLINFNVFYLTLFCFE